MKRTAKEESVWIAFISQTKTGKQLLSSVYIFST